MKLVMFDIDGTLTHTLPVDTEHFSESIKRFLGDMEFSSDWSSYPHVSDSAILHHLFMNAYGRGPHAAEVESFQSDFIARLTQAFAGVPSKFAPVPGAIEFLDHVRDSGFAVSIATGGWRRSALLKLSAAGFRVEGLPAGFADDAHSREDIMRKSYERACAHHGCARFDSVVYIGDGTHDVRASRNVGYGFIGIGNVERTERLRNAGARHVVNDFTDREQMMRLIAEAGLQASG